VIPFLWILGAIGVAWSAKQSWRAPFPWFVVGMVLTPIGGAAALAIANKQGWFRPR
jgi:hypothetical protein